MTHKEKKFRRELREALGDYVRSEGCDCCRDTKAHEAAAERIGKLLNIPKYGDGSGRDFYRYGQHNET